MKKPKIYLLPAFGTDEQLFENVHFDRYERIAINYFNPQGNEAISSYAKRLINTFNIKKEDYIMGVSFGGILSIEIGKLIQSEKIILISSIKDITEKPKFFSYLKKGNIYKSISPQMMKNGLFLAKPFFGLNRAGYLRFKENFKVQDNIFLEWALDQAIHWDNTIIPDNIIHIHGDKDPLFPIQNIKNPIPIKGGSHTMMTAKKEIIVKEVEELIGLS